MDAFADSETRLCAQAYFRINPVHGRWPQQRLKSTIALLKQNYPRARVLLGAGAEHLAAEITAHASWRLCGDASAISKILDPHYFFHSLDELAVKYPVTQFTPPKLNSTWLTKTRHSCGGTGVLRNAQAGTDGGHYWQQEVPGLPISVLCLAQTNTVHRLGINRQFVNPDLAADYPFIFAGVQANYPIATTIGSIIDRYISALADYFNYLGVFSLDMMWSQQSLYVLEMNPRIAASFELYEQLNPELNLVDAHIRVCDREQLTTVGSLATHRHAYRIVYAPQDIRIPASIIWPDWAKDRPPQGYRIAQGEPLCSVHSLGAELDPAEPMLLLQQRERELLKLLDSYN